VSVIIDVVKNAVKAGWEGFRDAIIRPVSNNTVSAANVSSSNTVLVLPSKQCAP
jgi:hypothetical protein